MRLGALQSISVFGSSFGAPRSVSPPHSPTQAPRLQGCIVKEIRIKSGVSRLLLPREVWKCFSLGDLGSRDSRDRKSPARLLVPLGPNVLPGVVRGGSVAETLQAYAEWIALNIYASSKSQATGEGMLPAMPATIICFQVN